MTALLVIIHVIICIVLILAVLLQSGKAADLAGAFGGAGSQTAFGPRGAQTLLGKITTVCAILFMVTSLGLWLLSGRTSSAVKNAPTKEVPAATQTPTQEPKAQTTPATAEKTEPKAQEPVKK
ncbi:MAG: preprotein translocase subunit SecG [Candidatus Saccharicenans sp.]|nr:preprotein translocase subunit SecG [Candidatus Saccharicenans sp.]MDH7492976.1 preprotein translocase subunit SecG [Candidatus Saccharicenans sp.]